MDVNMINPVLESFIEILPQVGFTRVKKTSLFLVGQEVPNIGLMNVIGVTGALKGSIIIGMEADSAMRVVSIMMGGIQVKQLDKIAQSAISELSNMVCANACSKFCVAGIDGLNISPPTLIMGKDARIKLAVPKLLAVKYLVDEIAIDIYVGLFTA